MAGSKICFNRTSRAMQILFKCFFATVLFAPLFSSAQKHQSSSFTSRLMNIEAATNATFTFNATLHNGSGESHIYNFNAQLPDGWTSAFRVEGSEVSSFNIDSNKTEPVTIEFVPSSIAKPGKYDIPVIAVSDIDTLKLQLEAVVKGTYGLQLTTPSGLLSGNITEGSQKEIQLVIKNTGTVPLNNINLSAQTPTGWEATFEPTKIDQLDAGKSQNVTATLKVPDKTIAGDYVTTFSARASNANSDGAFRMTVKTSLLSGWIGILLILIAIGIIYYLIRKYGRR